VTPDNERAYADVVHWAGQDNLLRQIYVHRGGHCSFTAAEVLTALAVLVDRIDKGHWPKLQPAALNASAAAMGVAVNVLPPDHATPSAFFNYQPSSFPRPYDVRSRIPTDG